MSCPITLLIYFREVLVSAFIISVVEDRPVILEEATIPFPGSFELTVIYFKRRWRGRFEQTLTIKRSLKSFEDAARIFATRFNFLLIEIGSQKSLLGLANFGRISLFEENFGDVNPLPLIGDPDSLTRLARFLTFPVEPLYLQNYLANRFLSPAILPENRKVAEIERSLLTETIAVLFRNFNKREPRVDFELNRIILSGPDFMGSLPNAAILCWLNGFGVGGIFQVFLDRLGLFAPLGYLLANLQLPIAQELPFENLGTVIIFEQHKEEGKLVGRLDLDLGLAQNLSVIIKSGDLIKIPILPGAEGTLAIELEQGVSLTVPSPVKIQGGGLGLIVDARKRPLTGPMLNAEGRRLMEEWLQILA